MFNWTTAISMEYMTMDNNDVMCTACGDFHPFPDLEICQDWPDYLQSVDQFGRCFGDRFSEGFHYLDCDT
jgi:hypothetical protein